MYIRKYEKTFLGIPFITEISCSGIYVTKIPGNV